VTLILKVPDLSDTGLMISVGELPGGIGGKVVYHTYQHTATPFGTSRRTRCSRWTT
jgi:hypothetical protein